jgi:hypothetical protein
MPDPNTNKIIQTLLNRGSVGVENGRIFGYQTQRAAGSWLKI